MCFVNLFAKLKSNQRLALLIILCFSLCSCSLFDKKLIDSKKFIEKHQYEEAINLLEGYSGSDAARKLLSEAYLGSGVTTLKNLALPRFDRYQICKEKFAKALDADPRNNKARDYYQALLKAIDKLDSAV